MNRPANQACENCFFWWRWREQPQGVRHPEDERGDCRCTAPKAFQDPRGVVQTRWPAPKASEWCGSWRAPDNPPAPAR